MEQRIYSGFGANVRQGNGFPKELYEPLWEDLIIQSKSEDMSIKAIFIADMVNQGQSLVLNRSGSNCEPSWGDYARDLLQVVNYFRREIQGPLIAVGHSLGATALINLSAFHPRLFEQLILVEPILGDRTGDGIALAYYTSVKPYHWPSREAARRYFGNSAPYRTWDARILESWLQYGLVPSSTSRESVVLATSRAQESIMYVRPLTEQANSNLDHADRPFDYVSEIDEGQRFYIPGSTITSRRRVQEIQVPVSYIFGAKSHLCPESERQQLLDATGKGCNCCRSDARRVAGYVVPNVSHLLPFEKPMMVAQTILEAIKPSLVVQSKPRQLSMLDATTGDLTDSWKDLLKQESNKISRPRSRKL